MYLLALGTTAIAAALDLRSRRIPNLIPFALLSCALALSAAGLHPLGWRQAVLGVLVATALTVPLFARGWFGGGDSKLFIALGATLGLQPFLVFFAMTCIAGGVFALRARRKGAAELPYAPVMLVGLLLLIPLGWLSR
ncbi:MAG: A24 family peptidase [Planctomycetota bacterium]|nr:A24 family peptidase [Planctomycetota bacterium]